MIQRIRTVTAERHDDTDAALTSEPSWFLNPANHQARKLPGAVPRPPSRHGVPSTDYRKLVAAQPRPPARFLEASDLWKTGRDESPRPAPAQSSSLKRNVALAAVLAAAMGGTVGYVGANSTVLKAKAMAYFAVPPHELPAAAQAPALPQQVTVIAKKSIATATLQVADATGQTNSLIPLVLRAAPASTGQNILLKISGLPDSAYLTSGHRGDDQVWDLSLDELRDVKLMVPSSTAPEIDLAVAAFETATGELAAPVKTMTVALSDVVIEPASAPPPQQTAAPKPSPAGAPSDAQLNAIPQPLGLSVTREVSLQSAAVLVTRGDTLLKSGDAAGARDSYRQAWANGAATGALGLARSCDPVVLAALQLSDIAPDKDQALAWYERAAIAGSDEAANAIVRLRLKR